jgi:hypothetical protein
MNGNSRVVDYAAGFNLRYSTTSLEAAGLNARYSTIYREAAGFNPRYRGLPLNLSRPSPIAIGGGPAR